MITRANFAQKTQESGVLTNQVFKETYDQLSEYTDGFTRWDDMDDVPELQDVFNDFVGTVEKVLAKKQAPTPQPAAPAAANDLNTGSSGFIALYKGKRLEVWADTKLDARRKAAKAFGAKKEHEVDVYFAEHREPQNAPARVFKFRVGDAVRMAAKSSTGYEYPNGGQKGQIIEVDPAPVGATNEKYDYKVLFLGNSKPNMMNEDRLVPDDDVQSAQPEPKFAAGDRVAKALMPSWGQGTVLADGSYVKNVYWYTVRWDHDSAAKGNIMEEDLEAAPAADPDRHVNEGKAAIRELLDQGKKKTPAKSKAGKAAKPVKQPKAKFKVGQYAMMGITAFKILEVRYAPVADGFDQEIGWHYRTNEIGTWVHEDSIKPTSKRVYDQKEADNDYSGANKVYATPEEVRHMKRFIANERSSTKDGLTKAYKALQRAITSGKIRKGSPYAAMIMLMQKEYHAALGNGAPYRVKPDDFDLAGMVKAVGGPTVYRSVKAMNYLVSKLGQVLDKKAIDGVIKYITGLRMPLIDPFALQVHEVLATLKKASSKGDTLDISNSNSLDLQGLNGLSALMGLAHQCGCGGAGQKSLSGLGNVPTGSVAPSKLAVGPGRNAGIKETMTSHELENLSYQTYPFKGKWAELIGSPQTNFTLMVWGSPGAGKSTLMMQFSRYLAENHGNVLYVSSEEFPSYTLKTKLNLVGGAAHGWEFSKTLNSLRADHKFLVIDSTNHYRFTTADLKALMVRRPDLSILLVVQITKGGNFKGDQSLEHEVDTVVKVTHEGATTIKNRFQPLSSVAVFDDSYSLTPKSNQPNVNQNRPTFY